LIKNNDIDIAAATAFLDGIVKDTEWKSTYGKILQECNTNITKEIDDIRKKYEAEPCKIKKEMCDAKYMDLIYCLDLTIFAVSDCN